VKVSAGVITAGGCLGILIPPSVMLIVYGAVAGVSVVQLYAGAFLPGIMLAGLYIGYVMVLAKIKPSLAPPLPESERMVTLPPANAALAASHGGKAAPQGDVPAGHARRQLLVALSPAIAFVVLMGLTWHAITKPDLAADTAGITISSGATESTGEVGGLAAAPAGDEGGLAEPPQDSGGLAEPPTEQ